MARKIFLTLLTLLVVFCIGLSLILIPGMALLVSGSAGQATAPSSSQEDPTRGYPVEPSMPQAAGDSLPDQVRLQMERIQRDVTDLRGLAPLELLERKLMSPEELRQQVVDDFFKDYTPEDADDDVRVLSAFGLLQPEFDLYSLYIDLYSEQVAGFYDPETKEMFVVDDGGFLGAQRMTYAHEYTHALQDQYFDLRNGLNIRDEHCESEGEYCTAVQALVEGDASLTELMWYLEYSTAEEQAQVMDFYNGLSSPVFDSAPAYLHELFLFPYIQGLEFAQSLYDLGGWEAIDQAFQNPPVSTEQIMHPDEYPEDVPVEVSLPEMAEILGKDWVKLDENILGEFVTYLVLSQGWQEQARRPADLARTAAAGWEGDLYSAWYHPGSQQGVMTARWLWESEEDSLQFWWEFSEYAQDRWGEADLKESRRLEWNESPDGHVTVLRQGHETVWIIAPNALITGQILDAIPEFNP